MRLETTRFGEMEIEPDAVITFTQPIIGFQEYRRFVVVPGPEKSGLTWLQSTESGELAFLLMDPRQVIADYKLALGKHELSELAVTQESELAIYTLVVVPADRTQIRTNLRAPVLINAKHRLGKQTVLEKSTYPIQHFLAQGGSPNQKSEEAGHARADA